MRKTLMGVVAVGLSASMVLAGCDRGFERWATTENTNVKIDFDAVNEAYKSAAGPEDFERRVNEIYTGDEIISVSVQDAADRSQLVTGFFDTNTNGQVEDAEKIFTIRREVSGENGSYQTTGYGHYGYYHSPVLSIVQGMLIGSMLSSAFRPNYVPVYATPYTTSAARAGTLTTARHSYRAANPSKFSAPKASGSGRNYGSSGRPSRVGGSRFGVRRRDRDRKPVRLTA